MTQTSVNYAKVLYELNVSKEVIEDTQRIFTISKELIKCFTSPVVPAQNKINIIEKIFPAEIKNFLKVLCRYESIGLINEIFTAYGEYSNKKENVLEAELFYVLPPDETQKKQLEQFLMKQFGKRAVVFHCEKKPELIGGFVLRAENREYDQSLRGRMNQLQLQLEKR